MLKSLLFLVRHLSTFKRACLQNRKVSSETSVTKKNQLGNTLEGQQLPKGIAYAAFSIQRSPIYRKTNSGIIWRCKQLVNFNIFDSKKIFSFCWCCYSRFISDYLFPKPKVDLCANLFSVHPLLLVVT